MQRFGELDQYKKKLREASSSERTPLCEEGAEAGGVAEDVHAGWQRGTVAWLMDVRWLDVSPLKNVYADSDEYAETLRKVRARSCRMRTPLNERDRNNPS